MRRADDEQIRAAVTRWGQQVPGAPRKLGDLVVEILDADDVVRRVATQVVHRELTEARSPGQSRAISQPAQPLASIDPFAFDNAALRTATHHQVACAQCAQQGPVACTPCQGSGIVLCNHCGGQGKERRQYASGSRLVKCTACKGSTIQACGACNGARTATCDRCHGHGTQAVCLQYVEAMHWRITVSPESALAKGHPVLRASRFLDEHELTGLVVRRTAMRQGMVDAPDNAASELLRRERDELDPRRERIVQQQYLEVMVPRKTVTYEMCGTRGTVQVTGGSPTGQATDEASRPFRRRRTLWIASVLALAGSALLMPLTKLGSSGYFAEAKQTAFLAWFMTVAASVPALGALLRVWRPGFRRWRLAKRELAAVVFCALCLLGTYGVCARAQPHVQDVEAAIKAGDLRRARSIYEALQETTSGSRAVTAVGEALLYAEATADGRARVDLLDQVAAGKGAHAAEAASKARATRIAGIQDALTKKDATAALLQLDSWTTIDLKNDAEVAELRAQAHDLAGSECVETLCRYVAAKGAVTAHGTDARAAAFEQAHAALLSELEIAPPTGRGSGRIKMLRAYGAFGKQVESKVHDDDEVHNAAHAVVEHADAALASTPLLGASTDELDALLESPQTISADIMGGRVDGIFVFINLDKRHRCVGVYAAGAIVDNRRAGLELATADRVLSQAIGKPQTVALPTQPSATQTSWFAGGTKVVARWLDGYLIELRVGDAAP